MTDQLQRARRDTLKYSYFYSGKANDHFASYMTKDPDLVLYVKPVMNDMVIGVQLVTADGTNVAHKVSLRSLVRCHHDEPREAVGTRDGGGRDAQGESLHRNHEVPQI